MLGDAAAGLVGRSGALAGEGEVGVEDVRGDGAQVLGAAAAELLKRGPEVVVAGGVRFVWRM